MPQIKYHHHHYNHSQFLYKQHQVTKNQTSATLTPTILIQY